MISVGDLATIAQARLEDSQVLYDNGRYDGAVYLCGYAVEMALKAQICRTLSWSMFPPVDSRDYSNFKIHNLSILLTLSGVEAQIKTTHLAAWSFVKDWSAESRYNPIGTATQAGARDMINAAATLLGAL